MVNIWQVNINKVIIVNVFIIDGEVQEIGDFEFDGVIFFVVEVEVVFVDFVDGEGVIFLIGCLVDILEVLGVGSLQVIMINVGIFIIFINVEDIGYIGIEF